MGRASQAARGCDLHLFGIIWLYPLFFFIFVTPWMVMGASKTQPGGFGNVGAGDKSGIRVWMDTPGINAGFVSAPSGSGA